MVPGISWCCMVALAGVAVSACSVQSGLCLYLDPDQLNRAQYISEYFGVFRCRKSATRGSKARVTRPAVAVNIERAAVIPDAATAAIRNPALDSGICAFHARPGMTPGKSPRYAAGFFFGLPAGFTICVSSSPGRGETSALAPESACEVSVRE